MMDMQHSGGPGIARSYTQNALASIPRAPRWEPRGPRRGTMGPTV